MSFLVGPAVSALVSTGASKLFGGGSKSALAQPVTKDISAGGLTTNSQGKTIGVSSDLGRQGLVANIAETFPQQANILQGLRESVTPGYSALRASRLQEIESARQGAIGNLRDNLARRRVLGSSFAQDAITRGEIGFAQEKEKAQAESFLQELDATQQLTQAEFTARRESFQTFLDELNLQADMATQLASNATSQLGANARLKAQLDAQSAASAGKFFQPSIDSISKGVTDYFNQPSSQTAYDPWAGLRTGAYS